MNVVILKLGGRKNGPETWREGLYSYLHSAQGIRSAQVDCTSVTSVLRPGWLIRANVIHYYHIAPLAVMYALVGRLLGKTIVFTMHGNFILEEASKRGLKRLLWRPLNLIALAGAHTITFPSAYLQNAIAAHLPWIKPKSRIIPNGIGMTLAPRSGRRPAKKLQLISVTSFNHAGKYEGLIPLMEAVTTLAGRGEELSLTVVGAGRALEQYRRRYASPSIRFAGYSNDAAGLIAQSDVLVHSTRLDNLPYVILEAMAAGKPVLATPTGGIPEMLPTECLVEPTAADWSQHLLQLIHQANYIEDLRRRCIAGVKKFDWNKVGARFTQAYRQR